MGAKVTITSRSKAKANAAVASFKEQFKDADIQGMVLELASLESVRACADEYIKSGCGLNILINNAGMLATNSPIQRTTDGFEAQVIAL